MAEINVYGWRFAYSKIFTAEELYKNRSVEKTIAVSKEHFTNDNRAFWVYEDDKDNIIKAMMGFGKCSDNDKQNSYEVYFIYVEPAFTNQGIGSAILKYVESEALTMKASEIIIWVFEKNIMARNCYEKNGYIFDGKTKKFKDTDINEYRYCKILT